VRLLLWAMLLCAFALGPRGHAEEPETSRPRWVIIATVVDRSTGKTLRKNKLAGPELEFADPARCKSVLDLIPPVGDDRVVVLLQCREIAPTEANL
jgi:hypothetical protein